MNNNFKKLLAYEYSDDCMVCRAQDIVVFSSVSAAAAWETANELQQYSVPLKWGGSAARGNDSRWAIKK